MNVGASVIALKIDGSSARLHCHLSTHDLLHPDSLADMASTLVFDVSFLRTRSPKPPKSVFSEVSVRDSFEAS
jgi:hypothetical protein